MIKNISIVGAGRMGRGIAAAYAKRGYNITIHDTQKRILVEALENIHSILGFFLKKKLMKKDEMDSTMARIRSTTSLKEAVRTADLVNESVPEMMDLKKELFRRMDTLCGKETILATNTSSLRVSEIAAVTNRPDRVVGIHWVYPAYIIPAVEVVVGRQTSEMTLNKAKQLVIEMGKVPIVCKDAPGFVINRLQYALVHEATSLLEQGVATAEDIDNATRMVMGLRFPFWGPLKVEDMVVPKTTVLAVYEYLYKETGSDSFGPPELVKKLVRKGQLGLVTGKGYYDFKDELQDNVVQEMNDMLIKMLKFLSKMGYAELP
jgi:3-hydroxybutyryl-CoA dehydrogenase